jgi:hypothetical protein
MNIISQLTSSGARNTVVGTVTRFQVENQAMWFNLCHGQEISVLLKSSKLALASTQCPSH